MHNLVQGAKQFQDRVFKQHQELFVKLAQGQQPQTLFITCSDSRVVPNLITQTQPGDLFILRNAGNLVPPYGASNGGEASAIEFAISALGVKDIVVCGHTGCGAMQGLLNPNKVSQLPAVYAWLKHAECTKKVFTDTISEFDEYTHLNRVVETNVLVQLDNLRTHPAVYSGLNSESLNIHGWVYDIANGQIEFFDRDQKQFINIRNWQNPEK